MTEEEIVKRFEETYHDEFAIDWDDDLKLLAIFSLQRENHDIQWIKAEFHDGVFDIYREFLYEDTATPLTILNTQESQALFTECLHKIADQAPDVDFDSGFGCPFYSEFVGYFKIVISWESFVKTFEWLVRACHEMYTAAFLDTVDTEVYSSFRDLEHEILEHCKLIAPDLCCYHINDTPLNNTVQNDISAYISQDKSTVIGVGREGLARISKELGTRFCTYAGINYFIIRSEEPDEVRSIFDRRLVDAVTNLFSKVEEDALFDPVVQFSLDSNLRGVMKCGNLWAIICGIHQSQYEKVLIDEKNNLKSLEKDFIQVAPSGLWNRAFDFTTQDDRQFENMCRDLLVALRFAEVRLRGNTRAADGGVDISAIEEYDTLLGKEQRKWIFQCKHTQGQINRKDLSEVRDLLTEFDADCYGLFYSGTFTPKTIDRIKTIRERNGTTIKAWDRNDLEILLGKFPTISVKYFGL